MPVQQVLRSHSIRRYDAEYYDEITVMFVWRSRSSLLDRGNRAFAGTSADGARSVEECQAGPQPSCGGRGRSRSSSSETRIACHTSHAVR
jgi:hypothetical protein